MPFPPAATWPCTRAIVTFGQFMSAHNNLTNSTGPELRKLSCPGSAEVAVVRSAPEQKVFPVSGNGYGRRTEPVAQVRTVEGHLKLLSSRPTAAEKRIATPANPKEMGFARIFSSADDD